MTINLEEIYKFVQVKGGDGIVLPGERRRVRLELNTAAPCQLMIQTGSTDLRFLATVEGRETLTFIADGPVTLWPDSEGDVWWWCSEIEQSSVVSDAPTFTKIAERSARNHDVERIVRKALENQERRLGQLMGELNAAASAQREEIQTLKAENKRARKPVPAAPAAAGGELLPEGAPPPAPPAGGNPDPTGADGGAADE